MARADCLSAPSPRPTPRRRVGAAGAAEFLWARVARAANPAAGVAAGGPEPIAEHPRASTFTSGTPIDLPALRPAGARPCALRRKDEVPRRCATPNPVIHATLVLICRPRAATCRGPGPRPEAHRARTRSRRAPYAQVSPECATPSRRRGHKGRGHAMNYGYAGAPACSRRCTARMSLRTTSPTSTPSVSRSTGDGPARGGTRRRQPLPSALEQTAGASGLGRAAGADANILQAGRPR